MKSRSVLFACRIPGVAVSFVLASVFLAGPVLGRETIPNWSAPATWSPPRPHGLTTLSETPPLPFVAVTPCRVADTRGNGFTGQYGPPSLVANATRSFTITGQCGIPFGAAAVSFNFTALNVGGAGDLRVFPTGGAVPLVSTLNYNANTPNIANAAVVPVSSPGGAITVQADAVSVDLIIDVNGYYSGVTISGQPFHLLVTNNSGPTLFLENVSQTCVGACGIYTAVVSPNATAIAGYSNSGIGVIGKSNSTAGTWFGVLGIEDSPAFNSAGIWGRDASDSPASSLNYFPAGVRGDSTTGYGVLGVSGSQGTAGSLVNQSSGTELAWGVLGFNPGTVYGVYSGGNFGGSGAKFFVEPHPTDASKVIRYVSLEGPEPGTYFRGRGRFQDGLATIEVPEDFRMVTDREGLSVQVTPIGRLASVAVLQIDLTGIVVEASRDVEFFFTVNGVRKTHRDLKPIVSGNEFLPAGPDAKMPAYLTDGQKAMLISNGTYKEDGSVNLETAERLGWLKVWADREGQAKAAASAGREVLRVHP